MQYTTTIPFSGIGPQDSSGIRTPSPFSYQGPHKDVYAGLSQGNLVDFQRAAQAADMQQMARSRDTQLKTALQGLQQQAQAQQYSNNLSNQMYGNQIGMLNSLLSGLY